MATKRTEIELRATGAKGVERDFIQIGKRGSEAFKRIETAARLVPGRLAAVDAAAAKARAGITAMGRAGGSAALPITAFNSALLQLTTIIGGAQFISANRQFEATTQQIVGLVGVAQEQVDAWRQSILDLSSTSRGPRELGEAMFFVTSAGFRGQAALDVLEQSARASAAGLGATAAVADVVTSAINAYGQESLSAAKATGILVAAVREGKASADTLAPALGRVLPVAAQLGVSFDQVAASVSAMTRIGLAANESVAALRGTLAAILTPTKQAEDTLAAFGLSSAQLRVNLRRNGLLDTLLLLQERFRGNDEAITKVFGNVESLTGVLALVGENADEVRKIFSALSQEVGQSTDTAFASAAKTIDFQLNTAIANLEAGLIRLGTGTNDLAEAVAKISENAEDVIAVASALLAFRLGGPVAGVGVGLGALALKQRNERAGETLEERAARLQGELSDLPSEPFRFTGLTAALLERLGIENTDSFAELRLRLATELADTEDAITAEKLLQIEADKEAAQVEDQRNRRAEARARGALEELRREAEGLVPLRPKELSEAELRERERAIAQIEELERSAQRAGLEGIALVEKRRDQEIAKFEKQLEKGIISQKQFERARAAIVKEAGEDINEIREDEAKKVADRERKEKKQIADREKAGEEQIKRLEEEARISGLITEEREVQIALADVAAKFERELDETEKKRIENAVRLRIENEKAQAERRRAEEEAERAAKRQAENTARLFINAATQIQRGFSDALFEVFRGSRNRDLVGDFLDFVQDAFARTLAELATLALVNPIIVPIVQAGASALGIGPAGLDAIAQAFGQSAGGGLFGGGDFLGLGLGLGSVGLGDAFKGLTGSFSGLIDSVNDFGAALGFGVRVVGDVGDAAGFISGGLTSAPFAGVAGAGLLSGLTTLLFGGSPLDALISGASSALGFAIGGPIGAVAGSFLGGIVSDLLGGGNPKPFSEVDFAIDASGNLVPVKARKQGIDKRTSAQFDRIEEAAQQIASILGGISQATGRPLEEGPLGGLAFSQVRGGFRTLFDNAEFKTAFQKVSKFAGESLGKDTSVAVAEFVSRALAQGVIEGLSPELLEVITRSLSLRGSDVAQIQADIALAAGLLDEDLFDTEELTRAEQALKAINDQFEEFVRRAEDLMLPLERLTELRDEAVAALTEGFDESVQQQILGIIDPLQAALNELERQQEERLKEAIALGADITEVERLNALEREQVIERFAVRSTDSLRRLLDELTFGRLSGASPEAALAGARASFAAVSAQAQAGDADALARLPEVVQDFVEASRNFNASGPAFQEDLEQARSLVASLIGGVPTPAAANAVAASNVVPFPATSPTGSPSSSAGGSDAIALSAIDRSLRDLGQTNARGFADVRDAINALGSRIDTLIVETQGQMSKSEQVNSRLKTTFESISFAPAARKVG